MSEWVYASYVGWNGMSKLKIVCDHNNALLIHPQNHIIKCVNASASQYFSQLLLENWLK